MYAISYIIYSSIKDFLRKYIIIAQNRLIKFVIKNINSTTYLDCISDECVVYNGNSYQSIHFEM